MRRALLIGLIAASIIMITAYGREGSAGPQAVAEDEEEDF